jgi:hypothetical protein
MRVLLFALAILGASTFTSSAQTACNPAVQQCR